MDSLSDSSNSFEIPPDINPLALYGVNNEFIKLIKTISEIDFYISGDLIKVNGGEKEKNFIKKVFDELILLINDGYFPKKSDIRYIVTILLKGKEPALHKLMKKKIVITARNKMIVPKTLHQKEYVDAIDKFDMVFGIGPAGTGKTYLAVAKAVDFFRNGYVERIVLVRPAVEAGEKLGFLPGDIQQKVDPFLRPLYDALYEMLSIDKVEHLTNKGIIEIIPLAFMRGRTLNNAFIIMDEAQNATPEQMKMFLTRTGFGSKVVVTGDITQIDLPQQRKSGLIDAEEKLKSISEIAFVYFNEIDVVRHKLVQDIIKAYREYETGKE